MTDFPALLSGMEGAFYAAFGEPALYHAPGSVEDNPCTVIRVGGGREITVGALRFAIEDMEVHVSRSALTPEPGATITIGAQTWTVGAVEPLAGDATSLTWACRMTWGLEAVWHRVTGAGSEQSPIIGGPWTVSGAHASGMATLTISAPYAVGALVPGDVLTVDGNAHTVAARAVAAAGSVTVSITPTLGTALNGGEDVTITPIGAAAVRMAPADWTADEIAAGVATDDRRFVLRATGLTWQPSMADRVILPGETEPMPIRRLEAVWSGETVAAWIVTIAR